NYYNEIKNKLIDNEIYSKIKDYSKEKYKVITYFEIGRLLNEAGGKYGENIIDEYSKKLVIEVGKKYNRRTLFRMKQFYNMFSDEKVSTLSTQLTWSHYVELLPFENMNKIRYYITVIEEQNLSIRQLRYKIKSNEYERLDENTKNKLINKEKSNVVDFVKNPIFIKNSNNYAEISEKILQKLILEDISSFMKELGNSFCFIDNEYKIKIGDRYNYIDLLLFNIEYNCYVVIELKVTELKKEHIGQI
ncbi:MAG: PDDEXK nuclease domain-containing protein, partial [Bacilli bacterium]